VAGISRTTRERPRTKALASHISPTQPNAVTEQNDSH
jgi:hypothetical protein